MLPADIIRDTDKELETIEEELKESEGLFYGAGIVNEKC